MSVRYFITVLLLLEILIIKSQNYNQILDSLWNQIYLNDDRVEKKALECLNSDKVKKSDSLNAKFHNLLGAIYLNRMEYTKAVEHFQQAVIYSRKIRDERGVYVSLFNLGSVYLEISDSKKALVYFKKILNFFEDRKDTLSLPNIYNNIGLSYMNLRDFDKSLSYFKKANALFRKYNDLKNLQINTINIAETYLKLGKIDSSTKYFKQALIYSEKLGDINNKFSCLYSIYKILVKGKEYESIKKQLLKFNLNDLNDQQKLEYLKFKINTYIEVNDYKNAYLYLEIYDSLKERILNNERQFNARLLLVQNEFNEVRRLDSIRTAGEKKLAALKLEKQQAENQKNNLLKWSFIVISVIISVFLILLFNRFKIIRKQKDIIEEQQKITTHQKELIEEKQKEILDSINYAKRIQNSLINDYKKFLNYFSESFLLYYPKDIVSGDFIWCTEIRNFLFVSCCDSTGHGVPGSYMSLLNMAFLSEAVNEKNIIVPAEILNYVRQRLIGSISRNKENKDGFDGSIIRFSIENGKVVSGEIKWASANQRIIRIKNNEAEILSYDRMPVGYYENLKTFSNFSDIIHQNEIIVLSTDGYHDQFGGEKNKKFTFKRFVQMLNSTDMSELHQNLENQFMNWKSSNIQTDDVCVIGLKI
jgi:tetratricopeptide (TPR) repeat protein